MLKELFSNEIELLDFRKHSEDARMSINQWWRRADSIDKRIKDTDPAGAVDGTTRMVLANGLLKGTWHSQFKPEKTKLGKCLFALRSSSLSSTT